MIRCAGCGTESPDSFKFCPGCGSPLAAASAPLPAAPAVSLSAPTASAAAPPTPTPTPTATAAREERRVVTVLFSDLAGFTSRSESLDPEDARALLVPYYAILENEITGHGGVVERHIGDGIMALFGAPVAHEDDPERAIRAALRILERIPALGTDLHARIGINTGEILYRSEGQGREDAVTGDAANTAARLQGLAPVDGVVVGESTWRATSRVFEYTEHPAATVKGKAEPIRVFQPTAPRARFGVDLTRTHDTPYVGRQAELAAITGAFEATVAERHARFVTVVAPAGMGKSRFIAQLGDHVEASPGLVTWRQGRCLPYGDGITFWALGEIVKAHAGILENDDPATASAKILDALPETPEREWLHQRLLPLVGVAAGSSAERGELFTAWRTFLAGIASQDPVVVLFEDLHWADEAMLAFIEDLAANAGDVPLLIVGTARPELFERHPGFAGGLSNGTRIDLAPLDDADAAELVAALLGSFVPENLRAPILERAAGNPLYVEEFVRLLGDRDLLEEVDGVVALRSGATLPLPGTIGALLAARLDMLEPDRRALLGNASVLGKVFWSGGVAALAERERAAVDAALAELSDRQLVRPAAVSSMAGEDEYAFWHVLARDVAYGQLPRATRALLHVSAAKWLESRAGERVEDVAELLAYHWMTALDLSRAAGQTGQAAELEAVALRYLTLAGDRAMNLDVAAAVANYERALALTPPGHEQRPGVLLRLGEAVGGQARALDALTYLEEAVAGYRAIGDQDRADAATVDLAQALARRGEERRSRDMADEVVARQEPRGPSETLVKALNLASRGNELDPHRIEQEERAIAMAADLGLPSLRNILVADRALRRVNTGDGRGMDDLRASLAAALEMGDQLHVARLYYWLGSCMAGWEDPQEALDFLDEGRAFTRRRGFRGFEFYIRQDRWFALFRLGRWREILEDVEAQIEEGTALGLGLGRTYFAKIVVLSLTGRAAEAARLTLEIPEDLERAYGFGTQRIRGLRSEGDDAGAMALLVDAVRHMREDDYAIPGIDRLGFVREAVGLGRLDLATEFASMRTITFSIDYPIEERSVAAIIAEADGRLADALIGFQGVASEWENRRNPYETAMASLGAGRCLVALGRLPEAAAQLTSARATFEHLGALPVLRETRSLLEVCAT